MENELLKKAGLTDSQAAAYLALVKNRQLSPTELADIISESRTNSYAITEKLEKLGLITRIEDSKKIKYIAKHPSAVEELAEKRRRMLSKNENEIKQNISCLYDLFYTFNELPGSKTLTGSEGIKSVYKDILNTKTDGYLLRTLADCIDLDPDYLKKYRTKRAELGINTYALTPLTEDALGRFNNNDDEKYLFHRTFMSEDMYSSPVEINVYGDKVALTAYGETQMTTIISSPPIAEAMRQILRLLITLIRKQEDKYNYKTSLPPK